MTLARIAEFFHTFLAVLWLLPSMMTDKKWTGKGVADTSPNVVSKPSFFAVICKKQP